MPRKPLDPSNPLMERALIAVLVSRAVLDPDSKDSEVEELALDLMKVPKDRLETVLRKLVPPKPMRPVKATTVWEHLGSLKLRTTRPQGRRAR